MLKLSRFAATLCIMASISSFAQANEHEKMMQQMMLMQQCISQNVSASYLEEMAATGENIATQVQQLCASGQRQQAQDTAMNYAKDMQNNPNFQAMQKCTEQLGQVLPNAKVLSDDFDIETLKEQHVCDEL